MKKYFAVADVVPEWTRNITAGKEYEISEFGDIGYRHGRSFFITDDNSDSLFCLERCCSFLADDNWRIIERDVADEHASTALDTQVGGEHYKSLAIQPIEYIHANNIGYAEGCVIKYVTRWRSKNGIEDLRKARHFIDLLIDLETKQ